MFALEMWWDVAATERTDDHSVYIGVKCRLGREWNEQRSEEQEHVLEKRFFLIVLVQ